MAEFDEGLAKALRTLERGEKPLGFAMLARGAEVVGLVVDRRPIPTTVLSEAKKAAKATVAFRGTVHRGERKELVFRVEEEPPVEPARVRKFLLEAAFQRVEPRFEVTGPEAPAFEPERARVQGGLPGLVARIRSVITTLPDRRDGLRTLKDRLDDELERGDLASAGRTFDALRELVREGEALASRVPKPPPPPEEREGLSAWRERVASTRFGRGATLGEGAAGSVVRLHPIDVRDVTAPKVVAKFFRHDEELEREAQLYEEIGDHPNLVRSAGIHEIDGRRALVLEAVTGTTLGHDLARTGQDIPQWLEQLEQKLAGDDLTDEERWGTLQYVLRSVLQGLAHLESKGFVHSDVKLPNLMVDFETGDVKLLDLGGAIRVGSSVHVARSDGWVAPEYEQELEEARRRSDEPSPYEATGRYDVWGIGRLLRAVTGGSTGRFVTRQGDEPGLAVDELLRGLTERDPKKRLSAEAALQRAFLSDPLVGEDRARAVLRRGTVQDVVPIGRVRFEVAPGAAPETWTENVRRALAAHQLHVKGFDPRVQERDEVIERYAVEGAERLRAVVDAIDAFRRVHRFRDPEARREALDEVERRLEAFDDLTSAHAVPRVSIDRQAWGVLEAIEAYHRERVDELRIEVEAAQDPPSPGALAAAWRELLEARADGYATVVDSLRGSLEQQLGIAYAATKPWGTTGDRRAWEQRRADEVLTERGITDDLVETLGLDAAIVDRLGAFDAADEPERVRLRQALHADVLRQLDAALEARAKFRPHLDTEREILAVGDLYAPLRARLEELAWAIDPDGSWRG